MLFFKLLRVKHWSKNILVLTGALLAYYLIESPNFNYGLIIFGVAITCVASSANYVLNEVLDAPFDKHHPEKNTRPLATVNSDKYSNIKAMVFYLLLVIISLFSGYLFINSSFGHCVLALIVSGVIYNVKPIRAKDICLLDVMVESMNSPIRLLLGWYLVAPEYSFPPSSTLLAWWAFGCILMTGKRHAELVRINDLNVATLYRVSLTAYTKNRSLIAIVCYSNLFFFSLGVCFSVYKEFHNLIILLPILLILLSIYVNEALGDKGNQIEPEYLLGKKRILLIVIVLFALVLLLLAIPFDIMQSLRFYKSTY